MDTALTQYGQERGFITRPDVLDFGYTDRDIREAKRAGLIVSIGSGLYALSAHYKALTAEEQHVIRCRAVWQRFGERVVITHQSGALVHEIPTWNVGLDAVNLTRRDGKRGRREAGVIHHTGRISDDEIVEVDGMLVASPARCVWETACIASIEAGLVTMDSALYRGVVSAAQIEEVAGRFAHWPGSRSARITARLSDGRAESPGESRSRHLFWRFHLPAPELQFYVTTADGVVVARTDFGWEAYRHLGEFDGKIKYDGTFGDDGKLVVLDEKKREDAARGELFGMSRLNWYDLGASHARSTATRFDRDLQRSRQLYTRNRVIIA